MTEVVTKSILKTAILQHEKEAGQRLSAHEKREQDLRHDMRKDFAKILSNQDDKIEVLHDDTIKFQEAIINMKEFMKEVKDEIKLIKTNQDWILRKVSYVGWAIAVIAGIGSFAAQIFF